MNGKYTATFQNNTIKSGFKVHCNSNRWTSFRHAKCNVAHQTHFLRAMSVTVS